MDLSKGPTDYPEIIMYRSPDGPKDLSGIQSQGLAKRQALAIIT